MPSRPIRHGLTLSLYYRDPDGNGLEFQIDLMGAEDANEFMSGPAFAANPIGEPFDPDALAARLAKRTSRVRVINMPRSPRKIDRRQPVCARMSMQTPPLDPDVADIAPSDPVLTVYDEEHLITYLRLLDAHAEGGDRREVARVVLHLDPEHEFDRARTAFDSHLSRARWMTEHGYRHLLRGGASA